MKAKVLPIILIAVIFTACQSKEEKLNKLIKDDLFKTLYDFESYEPIETIIDSAFTSIYRDSTILYSAANKAYDKIGANWFIKRLIFMVSSPARTWHTAYN